jgi:hypothetical protein
VLAPCDLASAIDQAVLPLCLLKHGLKEIDQLTVPPARILK